MSMQESIIEMIDRYKSVVFVFGIYFFLKIAILATELGMDMHLFLFLLPARCKNCAREQCSIIFVNKCPTELLDRIVTLFLEEMLIGKTRRIISSFLCFSN